MKKKIIFIAGPTAVGKSEAAFQLAKKIKGEIISCDSMQVYRGLNIVASKPPLLLRKAVAHHLISIISPEEEYDVSSYRREALKKIKAIHKRGKAPIFCGGTGLYLSVLIDGIFEGGGRDQLLRERLLRRCAKIGSSKLHQELATVDPRGALKIHPHDAKRIVRALEVFKVTGKPISELQKSRKGLSEEYDIKIFCLNMARGKLYQRIGRRVEEMFAGGVVKEAKALLKLKLSRTAACAIGLKELKGYFSGEYALEQARELIKKNTRAYAKRQMTWFRKDKRIAWVNIREKDSSRKVMQKIWKKL